MDQKQPEKKKRYVLLAVVLVCCVSCATPPRGLVLPPTLTQAQRATATAQAPTPTPTLLPHLAALGKTLAKTIVAFATVVQEDAVTLYFSQLLPQQDILIDAEETMSSLLKNPRLGDSAWNDLFAAQVARVRKADAALRRIVPPEWCREAHVMLLSSTGDSVLGYEYVLRGSQQLDPALLRKGGEYIKSATAKMNLFNLMLPAIITP